MKGLWPEFLKYANRKVIVKYTPFCKVLASPFFFFFPLFLKHELKCSLAYTHGEIILLILDKTWLLHFLTV